MRIIRGILKLIFALGAMFTILFFAICMLVWTWFGGIWVDFVFKIKDILGLRR